MTYYSVVKHQLPDNKISILGSYTTNLIALDYIIKDIDVIRNSNKFDHYETLINSDGSVHVIKRICGYIYNTKESYLVYYIIEITDDVVEQ